MHMGFVEPAFGRSTCCCMIRWQGQERVDEMHRGNLILNPRGLYVNIYDQASVFVCSYASLTSFG